MITYVMFKWFMIANDEFQGFKTMFQTIMPSTLVVIALLCEYIFVALQVAKGFPVLKDERSYSRRPRDSRY